MNKAGITALRQGYFLKKSYLKTSFKHSFSNTFLNTLSFYTLPMFLPMLFSVFFFPTVLPSRTFPGLCGRYFYSSFALDGESDLTEPLMD